ncbi:MAG: FAD-dependent oxidoreductase [Candidatus Nanopelagicales bacterium]
MPEHVEIVIIGGGVVGASIAYHLSQRGRSDVLVLERKSLTNGSTWHAAGLVGQLRSSASLTRLMQSSVNQYQTLEETTGYPTGWHGVGGLRVASSADRWEELKRIYTQGKSFGFDLHLVSSAEAKELFPLLNIEGVYGATWTPSDGYVDPSQLTHSFAAGARAGGVEFRQNCRVEAIERNGRRVTSVMTDLGRIECDVLVNATGMWGAETADLAGVGLAVTAVEHQYVVTEPSAAIPAGLPTFRDPDARFYLKPEGSALLVGGWEDGTRVCWRTVPRELGAELFAPNHDRFTPLAQGATNRVPLFENLGIRTWVNGPIPFSPDAEPLMGLTEDLDNLFHCCGFSAGIAAAGGAGQALASWIVDGDPGLDLWPFDARRFGTPHNVPTVLDLLATHAYEHYYDISYPNRPAGPTQGQRRSATYDRLADRGAVFSTKFGYERASWFAPPGERKFEEPTFGRDGSWRHVAAEHRAVREAVGIIDQSSFSKFRVRGPGSLRLLQRVAGADLDVSLGRVVYTPLLNTRGGIEADVTITRLGPQDFYLVTGSGLGRHDVTFLLQHAPVDGSVHIDDVTSAFGVLNVCGPSARDVLGSLSSADVSNDSFPYLHAKAIDLGWAPVVALRVSYAGELGYEIHVASEYVRDLYDKILRAGEPYGIQDVGYRAIESLRLEKHYLAWSVDVRPDNNPYEAGLGFAVAPHKEELLAGPALRAIQAAGPGRRLCWFSADGGVVMHGGELVAHPGSGTEVDVRSAGYGHTVARTIFSAYLPIDIATKSQAVEGEFEVEVMNERYAATRHDEPLYDPRGTRVRA